MNKFQNLIKFLLNYKLPKLLKKMTDQELLGIYCFYSPDYFNSSVNLRSHVIGSITTYTITEEFLRRYPNNKALQNWDEHTEFDLYSVIMNERKLHEKQEKSKKKPKRKISNHN